MCRRPTARLLDFGLQVAAIDGNTYKAGVDERNGVLKIDSNAFALAILTANLEEKLATRTSVRGTKQSAPKAPAKRQAQKFS